MKFIDNLDDFDGEKKENTENHTEIYCSACNGGSFAFICSEVAAE